MSSSVINAVTMFTDLKDYTLKISLLTRTQLDDMLQKQDDVIIPIVKKYNGVIVKNLGDSYMILFSLPTDSIICAKEIQEVLFAYNSQVEFELERIELRIAINIGEVYHKTTSLGSDYYGESVNVASRLLAITPPNCINITESIYSIMNKNEIYAIDNGYHEFKGIPDKVKVYEILYLESEIQAQKNNRLTRAMRSRDLEKGKINLFDSEKFNHQEVDKIIFIFSSLSAIVTAQPIPFIDFFINIPIQTYMVYKIALVYEEKIDMNNAKELLMSLLGIVAFNFIGYQFLIMIFKLGLPFLGGIFAIPLAFGITYGIGKLVNAFYYYKMIGKEFTKEQMVKFYVDKVNFGKDLSRENKDRIIVIGKGLKNKVMDNLYHFSIDKMTKFKVDDILNTVKKN